MRIALVNGYDDRNRGSCALTWAALDLLSEAWPGAGVTIIPTSSSPAGEDGFRHTRRRFPGVTVVDPPFDPASRSVIVRGAVLALRTAEALLGAHANSGGWINAIRDADLVVVRGGVSLHTVDRSVRGNTDFLIRMLPLIAARASGKPVLLLGAQIGPFRTATGRLLFRLILRNAHAVITRDAQSGQGAARVASADRIRIVPDITLGLRQDKADVSALFERQDLDPDRPTLALVIASELRPSESGAAHATLMANAARALLDAGLICQILIVVQTESDRRASRQLADLLGTAEIVDEDLDPGQLASLYGACRLVISSRLHGVLLSFLGGTPAISLAPEVTFKEKAVLDLLGLAELCVPTAADAACLTNACICVLADAAMPARIDAIVARARQDIHGAIPGVLGQFPLPCRH